MSRTEFDSLLSEGAEDYGYYKTDEFERKDSVVDSIIKSTGISIEALLAAKLDEDEMETLANINIEETNKPYTYFEYAYLGKLKDNLCKFNKESFRQNYLGDYNLLHALSNLCNNPKADPSELMFGKCLLEVILASLEKISFRNKYQYRYMYKVLNDRIVFIGRQDIRLSKTDIQALAILRMMIQQVVSEIG